MFKDTYSFYYLYSKYLVNIRTFLGTLKFISPDSILQAKTMRLLTCSKGDCRAQG